MHPQAYQRLRHGLLFRDVTLSGSSQRGGLLSGGVAPGYFMNPLRGFAVGATSAPPGDGREDLVTACGLAALSLAHGAASEHC